MKGKHVLITGHTGFKGSWLIAMLHHQGIRVSGIALDPVTGGIFEKAALHELLAHDIRLDIRDSVELKEVFRSISPDVVIHLAAQPLVLASYEQPTETYETNVLGTLNVLNAVKATTSVEATLIVTTDKVYRQDRGEDKAYVESDALGAADPYSTSKAMADLLTQSWMDSHPNLRIAIARAGNVIGGGDIAENRLLPDVLRSFGTDKRALLRSPDSVRPWQHVLDCLNGYVALVDGLLGGKAHSDAYNFGPAPSAPVKVRDIADLAVKYWGAGVSWHEQASTLPLESKFLILDSTKSRRLLQWKDHLSVNSSVKMTVEFTKNLTLGMPAREALMQQINFYYSIQSNSA